ncbi:hypothetical protein K1T71_003489 [Dendrolimus kikuchii]|uniref:Uncharacterized protein n=1 Tax=Dendrolimus kikuchii TaxID=765133 RepID=A0ACC1DCD9_9NEOP|nr:hypothetical protein K1T71_003489 [Dendrolimus kikuchii]
MRKMLLIVFILHMLSITCQDFMPFEPNKIIIGNLGRREVVPLTSMNRRAGMELSYRKTKDIREDNPPEYKKNQTNKNEINNTLVPIPRSLLASNCTIFVNPILITELELQKGKLEQDKINKIHEEISWLSLFADDGSKVDYD